MRDRRIFFIIFFSIFVATLGCGIIAPAMPLYAQALGASGFWLGVIYATFSVSRVIFMPLAGRLSDLKGRKDFLITGLTIYTIISFGYIWSQSVVQLTGIRFLHGLGSAMVIPIASAIIGDISPRGKEGSMMGDFQVALFLGFGVGPLLGGVIMDAFNMSAVFYIVGVLSFFSLLCVILFLPKLKDRCVRTQDQISSFRILLTHSMFKGLLIYRFSNAVGRAVIIAFLPIFASDLQMTSSQIGILVSTNILLTSILQHGFGKVADRFHRPYLVIGGNILAALPLLLMPLATNFYQLLALGIMMGVGGGVAFPAGGALVTEVGREHGMGNVIGYINMAMNLGSIVGSVVAGCVMDLFGLPFVFIFGGIVGLLGSVGCIYWMVHGQLVKR
ncbi:MFS transporter [bacterium]|nr:MFS transporter [bacterium]